MLRPVPEFALLMAACSVIPILSKLQFQPSLHKKDGFTPAERTDAILSGPYNELYDQRSNLYKDRILSSSSFKGFQRRNRLKRMVKLLGGVVQIGHKAVRHLLRGAKWNGKQGEYLVFIKSGGVRQATKDFEAITSNSMTGNWKDGVRFADVGNRHIILSTIKWDTHISVREIHHSKAKDYLTIRINYKK